MSIVLGAKINGVFYSNSEIKAEAKRYARRMGIREDESVIGTTVLQQIYFIIANKNR